VTTSPAKILIADDERAIAEGLSAILSDEGYAVEVVTDGQRALDALTAETYGVALADLKMPKLDGLALLRELKQREIGTECIIITGQATVDSAVQAMLQGAYDYIEKPLTAEKLNRLKVLIAKAMEKYSVTRTNRELVSEIAKLTHYGEITGQSEAMRAVYQIIDAVAPSTASVLILGESGTGKELVARAIHLKSDRAKGPFLPLNCAALPKDILENELFGHEKGAFTGSVNEEAGAFEMAHGGTLFLDEVGEMAPDIQVKLLRALESRTVRRLGGKREIPVDIRVVAATNKDLQKALSEGEIREDLYYRLAVVEVFLPPLRERIGDIKLLAQEFLHRFAKQNGKKISDFEPAAMDWIMAHAWAGNVRELKNAVESAVIMARGSTIGLQDIVPRRHRGGVDFGTPVTLSGNSTLADARRQLVLRHFAMTGGDIGKTAHLVGLPADDVRTELASLIAGGNARTPDGDNGVVAPAHPLSSGKSRPKTKGRR